MIDYLSSCMQSNMMHLTPLSRRVSVAFSEVSINLPRMRNRATTSRSFTPVRLVTRSQIGVAPLRIIR